MPFHCACCGREYDGKLRDLAYAAPLAVAAVPDSERAARVKLASELCAISEGRARRFFLRGVLPIPVVADGEGVAFGVWAEVTPEVFARHLEFARVDATDELPGHGTLANEVRGYPGALGLALGIHWGTAKLRPTFRLAADDHVLVHDQRQGMPVARFHSIFVEHRADVAAAASPPRPIAPRLLTCAAEHTTRAWPFATPPTLATRVTAAAMRGAPVLRAFHELDGSWTFLHADDANQADLLERCHQHVVDLDRSLRLLADLPRGSAATREGRLFPWAYRPLSPTR
jgi:hypothetical protein